MNGLRVVRCLFARRDSVYKAMAGVDVWDADRDARQFPGGSPIVAHPPCRAWASLRHCAKPEPWEKDLARMSVRWIREFGGVLEHPQKSTLWADQSLPEPGCRDRFGGFTLVVDQFWWGHRARKRTRLYVVGCEPSEIPQIPIVLGDATHTVGLWSGRNRLTCRPSIRKCEFESTPERMARWLVDLARVCATQ